ncbi:MAG: hypothetical protein WAX69_01050 [Victivallales bacterium]
MKTRPPLFLGGCLMALAVMAFAQVLIAGEPSSSERWQGPACGSGDGTAAATSRWLILDTGGSGGGFGKGDIRKALGDVFFWNESLGWACGWCGIFKTTDGGFTWKRMLPPCPVGELWGNIEMTGSRELWILKYFHGQPKGQLMHSIDDGATWREVLPGELKSATDLYCRLDERWVLCGDFPSYRSEDGGKTWRREGFGGNFSAIRISIPPSAPYSRLSTVYALGKKGKDYHLRKSVDGGKNWFAIELPASVHPELNWRIPCVFFATDRVGWIGTPGGGVLFTGDGGGTWERRDLPVREDQDVTDFWFDQFGRGFASVLNGNISRLSTTVYESGDYGKTWTPSLSGSKQVSRFFSLGPGFLWAVGSVVGFVPNDLVAILIRR